MALGLARVFVLQLVELGIARGRAGDPAAPWRLVARRTLAWALLGRALRRRDRVAYNLASILFHAGIIVVPLFLWGHTALWQRALGVALPALPPRLADTLTLVTVAALGWLVIWRAVMPAMRTFSGAQDWLLPILCGGVFLRGSRRPIRRGVRSARGPCT